MAFRLLSPKSSGANSADIPLKRPLRCSNGGVTKWNPVVYQVRATAYRFLGTASPRNGSSLVMGRSPRCPSFSLLPCVVACVYFFVFCQFWSPIRQVTERKRKNQSLRIGATAQVSKKLGRIAHVLWGKCKKGGYRLAGCEKTG